MRNPSTLPLSSPKAELPHPGESFVTTTDPFRESGKFTPMGVAAFDVLGRKELQLRLSKAARRLHSEERCSGHTENVCSGRPGPPSSLEGSAFVALAAA
jgi:hypothetical protein